jgi:hypothetical protein
MSNIQTFAFSAIDYDGCLEPLGTENRNLFQIPGGRPG